MKLMCSFLIFNLGKPTLRSLRTTVVEMAKWEVSCVSFGCKDCITNRILQQMRLFFLLGKCYFGKTQSDTKRQVLSINLLSCLIQQQMRPWIKMVCPASKSLT